MRPSFLASPLATALGCVALLLVSCSPTVVVWLTSGSFLDPTLEGVRIAASDGLPRDSSFLIRRVTDPDPLTYNPRLHGHPFSIDVVGLRRVRGP